MPHHFKKGCTNIYLVADQILARGIPRMVANDDQNRSDSSGASSVVVPDRARNIITTLIRRGPQDDSPLLMGK